MYEEKKRKQNEAFSYGHIDDIEYLLSTDNTMMSHGMLQNPALAQALEELRVRNESWYEAVMDYYLRYENASYGKLAQKYAHGTQNLDKHTSSTRKMVEATMTLFERIFDKTLLARRINLVACNVIMESDVPESENYEQLSLFDTEETIGERADDEKALEKERALQEAMLTIKHKFGKNAVLKGTNFTEGATAKERNSQIGGHKA